MGVDYLHGVLTPQETQEAEARERQRQNAIRKAQQGNAPVGREQPAAPAYRVGQGNAAGGQARAAKYAAQRGEVLVLYDRLRLAHPLAKQKDIYAAVAQRCAVPDKTVRYWVQNRNRETEYHRAR